MPPAPCGRPAPPTPDPATLPGAHSQVSVWGVSEGACSSAPSLKAPLQRALPLAGADLQTCPSATRGRPS